METVQLPELPSFLEDVAQIIGVEDVATDEFSLIAYSRDAWPYKLLEVKIGIMGPRPNAVVWPHSTSEVAEILKLANKYAIPIIPFGGGASVSGGIVVDPRRGGVILDVKKMDQVLAVDEESMTVTVQPGILGYTLEEYLNKRNLSSCHLPSSDYTSTVGGFLASRSAGALSSKYGKIEDMCEALEVVVPTGEVVRTRKVPRSATGPDFKQLFIGSEGTLGVITEATLRIWPQPEDRRFDSYLFANLKDAITAVREFFRHRIFCSILRLYDDVDARMSYGLSDIPKDAALLIVAWDGDRDVVDLEQKKCTGIAASLGGEPKGAEYALAWFDERHKIYYPNRTYEQSNMLADTIDVCANYDKLMELYDTCKAAIAKYKGLNVMAHFSHFYPEGGSIYMIFVMLGFKGQAALDRYKTAWKEGMDAALRVGGSMSHHHGAGSLKSRWIREELGSQFPVLEKIKKVLDPNDICNPGKLGLWINLEPGGDLWEGFELPDLKQTEQKGGAEE
ncbi:MAG TPA: FAD-binding oxidoreductase [Candidatus Lokiarchaeia archaeon]|nr:FAD-binding oxidoreductase [Candidatus Lokiarchaeia archaeon]